eukprot:TRINITY_DN5496_c0_g2_i1.p1 TRINITY_DN5496_c0_g2~~TRINITY_DN5496_c0_g2_i1.p1  ORF type:complete len:115 (+),score=12.75 TRINITY_DN5496_c0_g2_i1:214-558(+)
MTVFWTPITLLFFPIFLQQFYGDSYWHTRVLFFPFNIFVAETFCGYFLSRVWGTRAWDYRSYPGALFDGNITLLYTPLWWFLGFIHEYAMVFLHVPVSLEVEGLINTTVYSLVG